MTNIWNSLCHIEPVKFKPVQIKSSATFPFNHFDRLCAQLQFAKICDIHISCDSNAYPSKWCFGEEFVFVCDFWCTQSAHCTITNFRLLKLWYVFTYSTHLSANKMLWYLSIAFELNDPMKSFIQWNVPRKSISSGIESI